VASRKIRAILADLDGTLLNDDLGFSEYNRIALKEAHQRGVSVILASGRPTASVALFTVGLSETCIIITSNGGCAVELPEMIVLRSTKMAAKLVRRLVDSASWFDLALCIYSPKEWYVTRDDEFVALEVRRSGIEPSMRWTDDLAESGIIKVMFVGDHGKLAGLMPLVEREYAGEVDAFFTYPEYLEVMPKGVSKHGSCDAILQRLGIAWSECVAIGDGYNDIAMMRDAYYRVAVANADERVKRISNVFAPSNNNDGAGKAVRALVLGDNDALGDLVVGTTT
jgi:Cof subfamily protein (haloacid dehalogenase superfamily)